MGYDVIVIGAGLSGLSAAALLAKRGLKVTVIEQASTPGGACGIFKRAGAIFDKGVAMLYGFGEKGFNAHRFLFNCLEEPFEVVKHDLLYVVHYRGKKIRFWPDVDRFIEELSGVFPNQKENIEKFYTDMKKMYNHVISETPSYTTPDETNPKESLNGILKHPLSYLKFLSYLNMSTEKLLRNYFTDPEIISFFNKLTSTYCYATVKEAPAILAAVMFIDNHEGGSYYPAGSTLFLPGKLEKVIEEHNGEMRYDSKVEKLLFDQEKPIGVLLESGEKIYGNQIIYSGTVWNLYEKLLPSELVKKEELEWERAQVPTYPSVVLYALVDSAVIPDDTEPIEMLAASSQKIDESEVTVYILSIDDHTLCQENQHTVVAVGPSFLEWDYEHPEVYEMQKQDEMQRMIECLNKRFPSFEKGILYCELATPKTIERYTLKNGGAAAGPKQMLGQHMLMRQKIRTRWENLFCCGESTVMGTGTPTVTTSGIAAANAILKKQGQKTYSWKADMENYVHVLKSPIEENWMKDFYISKEIEMMKMAGKCMYCESPSCCNRKMLDIPGIMRRVSCGNFAGGKHVMVKAIREGRVPMSDRFLALCEKHCVQNTGEEKSNGVEIRNILKNIQSCN